MSTLNAALWPFAQIGEATTTLARAAGLRGVTTSRANRSTGYIPTTDEAFDDAIVHVCSLLGIEAEQVETTGAVITDSLPNMAPALLRYRLDDQDYVLAMLGSKRGKIEFIDPKRNILRYPVDALCTLLAGQTEQPIIDEIAPVLRKVGLSERKQTKLLRSLVRERMAAYRYDGFWILRLPATAPFRTQVLASRILGKLGGVLTLLVAVYSLEVMSWIVLGYGALNGRLDLGWLLAWALLLLLALPLRLGGTWLQGRFAIEFGLLLKRRLLTGALQLPVALVRRQGVGQLLSQVIESQALESLALNGGFAVLAAGIELIIAVCILSLGGGGAIHVAVLLAWVVGLGAVVRSYYHRLQGWTKVRLDLTHDLIERMVGHRTRIMQESRATRHADEDQHLDEYLRLAGEFDRGFVRLAGGIPRGWLVLGLLGMAPYFVAGAVDPGRMAVTLGGVLLAYRALGEMIAALVPTLRAVVAWKHVSMLFMAGGHTTQVCPVVPPNSASASSRHAERADKGLLQARQISFTYPSARSPTINHCNLSIHRGDRVLLEGSSGSGKSTLAALLAGLRQPDSGLLLLDGLDQASLGKEWRRLSAMAPQFHENHILTGTFAFNLLMGRAWPPSRTDLDEAENLCIELGFSDLLGRMPSGLMQMLGETGWQLSHGERSRLYLARALLQKARLIVLDECFAALDPDTLAQCLQCVLVRAPSLLVIAHR
jgi:ATP-binding cassette, subfamily B, bacterial